jgi:AraC-like DNA-binding protein
MLNSTTGPASGPNLPQGCCSQAGPALRDTVLAYVGYRYGKRSPQRRILFPDTSVNVQFGFGLPVRTVDLVDPLRSTTASSRAELPHTTALLGEHGGEVHGIVMRLNPMGAYRLFGVPMAEWDLPHLDPALLLPPALRYLPEQLEETETWSEQFRLLDRHFTPLLERGPQVAPEVEWAWRELHRSRGLLRVRDLAIRSNWSVRHLERRFREQVGRSPGEIARILRFGNALRLQDTGLPLAKVALAGGFHDQAHYNHVFKSMTGFTPTQVPANRVDWSPYTANQRPDGGGLGERVFHMRIPTTLAAPAKSASSTSATPAPTAPPTPAGDAVHVPGGRRRQPTSKAR